MKIFKFGGASVKNAEAIKNVASIIASYKEEFPLIVISALGKTTNALEEVINLFNKEDFEGAQDKIDAIKSNHNNIATDLFETGHLLFSEMDKLFDELIEIPKKHDVKNYNFLYDQVVGFGELLSTKIVSHYLNSKNVPTHWLDVRAVIRTDSAYREAKVNWDVTTQQITDISDTHLNTNVIVTQGFIGSNSSNDTTTLGREGSDFTASIFASVLNAEELVIWKDVPGVLNANPTLFQDTKLLRSLPYSEAIEMTYYGAQVIHTKTIKPLQNKGIPLHVRSFIDTNQSGTLIHNKPLPDDIPPIIVYKRNQVFIELRTKDFSFMADDNLGLIYDSFAKLRIKSNVMQNAAISLSVCFDYNETKLNELIKLLETRFNITTDDQVEVLTIRHYNGEIIDELLKGKEVIVTQKTKETIQCVIK